ncbi:MAG: NifB/NifX family molybdenum-iron cluster-binding protein [Oligoflexia bacterium]|nr:NifB/NifX family molybdenum-iron cluster-binding protein [Oligoflexia bacterium]
MKLAISSTGINLDSLLDPRFGRAKYFIIIEDEQDESKFTSIDNVQNLNATEGAGIQTATLVIDQSVDAVITGNCGPKAFKLLKKANIKVFLSKGDISISSIIKEFKNNQLEEITEANVEGHW